jgi:hypothetical protein
MATKWNGPPLPGEKRQAGKSVEAGGQDDSQNTPLFSGLQFTRRRAAGLEQLNVILDDFAEYGWPICTATAEALP